MGLRGPQRPLTQVAMDAAEDAEDSVIAFAVTVERSIADRRITDDEVIDMSAKAARMKRALRAATVANEAADIAQAIATNLMRGGIAESTRLRARDAGLIVPDFRIDMPQDAA